MAALTDLIPTGTLDFDPEVRKIFDEWQTAIEVNIDALAAADAQIGALESGAFFAGLSSPVIPGSAIVSLSVDKIAITGTVSDGTAMIYRTTTGWGLEPIEGVVGGDTYQVKFSSVDTVGFLEEKIATDAEYIAGASITALATPAGLKLAAITASVSNLGVVSGTVSISPTHEVHVVELSGDTLLNLSGFTDASVHYTVMLVITNASHSLSFGNSIRWPGDRVPELDGGRCRLLLSTYDGGLNWDASEALAYA